MVEQGGILVKSVKNPALQVVRDRAQTIRAYALEFGLTPSARVGLSTNEDSASDLDGLLASGRQP
jgi:phage terminase small subunit